MTMWHADFEKNEWTIEALGSNMVTFQSWKGDYLHKPLGDGVDSGVATEWTVYVVGPAMNEVTLQSPMGDFLHKPDGGGVTTWPILTDNGNVWTVIRVG